MVKTEDLPSKCHATVALIVFIASVAVAFAFGRDENSAWIRITQPIDRRCSTNPLIGYSDIHGASVIHRENESFLKQISQLYAGVPGEYDIYFVRPMYSFIASFFAVFFGVIPALLITNLLGWALAAFAAWHFTKNLFGCRAAMFAVILVSAGTGFVLHLADYSSHLTSFAFYYLGVYVLYESRVWSSKRPFADHMKIGLFLAVCCLQYNSGLSLAAAYFFMSLGHNRTRDILSAVAIAVLFQRLWVNYINLPVLASSQQYVDLYKSEARLLANSVKAWSGLASDPWVLLGDIAVQVFSFISSDYLPVTVAGIVCCIVYFRRNGLLRFAVPLFVFPVLSGLAFSHGADARGYIIFGASILTFSALGAWLAGLTGKNGRFKPVIILLIFAFLASYFAWSFSCLFFGSAPAKTFFLGLPKTFSQYKHRVPDVMSLTGEEFKPRLMGGNSSMAEAGLAAETAHVYSNGPSAPPAYRMRKAGFFRLYLSLPVILLVVLMMPRRFSSWKRIYLLIFLFYIAPSILLPLRIREAPRFNMFYRSAEQSWSLNPARYRYSVRLSGRFAERMIAEASARNEVEFLTGFAGAGETKVFIGERRVALVESEKSRYHNLWRAKDPEALINGLRESDVLTFEFDAARLDMIPSWQINGLAGRALTRDGLAVSSKELDAAPVAEIRIRRHSDGTLILAGF